MVSPLSLYLFVATLLLLAAGVGRLRRTPLREALDDGCAALVGALVPIAAAIGLFASGQPLDASELWHRAGSQALLASPLGATLALRCRGRGSVPRALLAAALAQAGVVLWLTLNLRGPRGGWSFPDVVLVASAAGIAVASAACLGWWSKRRALGAAAATGR